MACVCVRWVVGPWARPIFERAPRAVLWGVCVSKKLASLRPLQCNDCEGLSRRTNGWQWAAQPPTPCARAVLCQLHSSRRQLRLES